MRPEEGKRVRVENMGIWAGPLILVLSPTRCVTTGKTPVFLGLCFSICRIRGLDYIIHMKLLALKYYDSLKGSIYMKAMPIRNSLLRCDSDDLQKNSEFLMYTISVEPVTLKQVVLFTMASSYGPKNDGLGPGPNNSWLAPWRKIEVD